jgi:glycosyltransferase involved in cell wall biosynthesis
MSVDLLRGAHRSIGDAPRTSEQHPRIAYVVNSFDRGGAEAGLLALIKGGLFRNCRLKVVALARGRGGFESVLSEMGHPPDILLDAARMRTVNMPGILLRLWRLLGEYQPHVVIASLPQANLLARSCLLFRRDTVAVSFEHNTHLAKRVYELGFRLTSFRVDWTFADAASTLEQATERLYRRVPKKRTIVPLVSFEGAANRTCATQPYGPFRIVNAARFTAPKNQAALIEAVAILHRDGREVILRLYGEGPERTACEELARRLGIEPQVQFAGFVTNWSSQAAELFVLASKHEGLCIAVLEAMHAGIPVVAPIVGGLCDYATPDVVRPIAAVDAPTIAAAIAAAMDDRAGLAVQVANAAEMVDRKFGMEAVYRVYAEINQALVNEAWARAAGSGSTTQARDVA